MRNKRLFLLLIIALMLIVGFLWFQSRSVLVLEKPDGVADASYIVTDAKGKTTAEAKLSKSVSLTVPKSVYQVVVTTKDKSYITFVSTKGFLKRVTVSPVLTGEAKRTFVGDNPSPCMYPLGNRFYSTECQVDSSSLQEHMPADSSLPTYVQPAPTSGIPGNLGGIITTKAGETLALVLDGDTQLYTIYKMDANLTTVLKRTYKPVNSGGTYSIKPYRDGFVVSSPTTRTLDYFSSFTAESTPITLETARDKTRDTLLNVIVEPSHITAVYVSSKNTAAVNPSDYDAESEQPKESDVSSEVVVVSPEKQEHFSLDFSPYTVIVCGDSVICTFARHTLDIYKLSGSKTEHYFTMKDVDAISDRPDGLRVISKLGIMKFDQALKTGHLELSFGDYQFADVQFDMPVYAIALINSFNDKQALVVDPSQPNTDSIDKKILGMLDAEWIKNVSTNRNTIYITPNYGETVYDSKQKINTYRTERVKQSNSHIDELIARSGIDKNQYTIISTGYTP